MRFKCPNSALGNSHSGAKTLNSVLLYLGSKLCRDVCGVVCSLQRPSTNLKKIDTQLVGPQSNFLAQPIFTLPRLLKDAVVSRLEQQSLGSERNPRCQIRSRSETETEFQASETWRCYSVLQAPQIGTGDAYLECLSDNMVVVPLGT